MRCLTAALVLCNEHLIWPFCVVTDHTPAEQFFLQDLGGLFSGHGYFTLVLLFFFLDSPVKSVDGLLYPVAVRLASCLDPPHEPVGELLCPIAVHLASWLEPPDKPVDALLCPVAVILVSFPDLPDKPVDAQLSCSNCLVSVAFL